MAITGLVFALLGHSFSCWTRFKGGKGVATSAGGLIVLLPLPTLLAVVAWVTVFQVSRYVSLASIVASVVLPAVAWILDMPTAFAGLASLLGVFVILRHRANITRLLNGTENKFVKKPRATASERRPYYDPRFFSLLSNRHSLLLPKMSSAPVIHIGICGLGTVGQGVWKHIERALPDLEARLGARLVLARASVRDLEKSATSA